MSTASVATLPTYINANAAHVAHEQRLHHRHTAFDERVPSVVHCSCGLPMLPKPVAGATRFPQRLECPTHGYPQEHRSPSCLAAERLTECSARCRCALAKAAETNLYYKAQLNTCYFDCNSRSEYCGFQISGFTASGFRKFAPFQSLAEDFTEPQDRQHLGKPITSDGQSCEIVAVHPAIRLLLRKDDGRPLWVPRGKAQKLLRRERIKQEIRNQRRTTVSAIRSVGFLSTTTVSVNHGIPHYTGDPRPPCEKVWDLQKSFHRELPQKMIDFLMPLERSLCDIRSYLTKRLAAVARIDEVQQLIQKGVKAKARELSAVVAMEYLRSVVMLESKKFAVWDVLNDGADPAEVAKRRGIDKRSLRLTLQRIRRRIAPLVQDRLGERMRSDLGGAYKEAYKVRCEAWTEADDLLHADTETERAKIMGENYVPLGEKWNPAPDECDWFGSDAISDDGSEDDGSEEAELSPFESVEGVAF